MRTMLITDCWREDWEKACKAGIGAIQLRNKESSAQELWAIAKRLREITRKWGVKLLINERSDIALAVGADGVHFPEKCQLIRAGLTGKSVHSIESALQAEAEGADYLLFGPVFETALKPIAQGVEKLKQLVSAVKIPVYAVGGIGPEKIPALQEAGAAGAAAISYFSKAPDLARAVRAMRTPIRGLLAIVSSVEIAQLAVAGGAKSVQFRHKGSYTQEIFDTARQVHSVCQSAKIPFLINDRADIALALDASGVHLGQTDLPIQEARKLLGPDKIIGGTASNPEEALSAEAAGADYIGYGHIFPTQSQQKSYPPIGLQSILKAKQNLKIPLIAIGGIDETNIDSIYQAGADGAAILSAIPSFARNYARL
jgi:thiamine-phosphate pyrophosphorylase